MLESSVFVKFNLFFRCYLRSREDTVRSVVNSLLDDSPSELADELVKGECLQLDDGSADDETEDWEKWMPDPVDADPGKPRSSITAWKFPSIVDFVHFDRRFFIQTFLLSRIYHGIL